MDFYRRESALALLRWRRRAASRASLGNMIRYDTDDSDMKSCLTSHLARHQKYRSCTRLVVRVPELAAELWRRIRPLLRVEDIANVRVEVTHV